MKETLLPNKAKYHRIKADVAFYDKLEDNENNYQLIEGVLEVAASPIHIHQKVSMGLIHLLLDFLETHPIGELYSAPFDVELDNVNVFQPDLLFISKDRLPIIREKRVVGSPNLVIEILSDSTKHLDYGAKYKVYEKSGVLEYWIVDPQKENFQFYQLVKKRFQKIQVQDSYSSSVLSSFTLRLSDFWESL
ncbi:MAG TPA: Uma2 family endonuclease [Spirochaetes bacterium]|nr:Uma2 family endonuclease [Spirochaetota bacterium]